MSEFSYSTAKMIKVGFFGWLWRHRSAEFTFPRMMNGFEKVLLLLPRDVPSMKLVRRWRERILFSIGDKKVVVLSIGTPLEFAEEWSQKQLFFTDGDITPFGTASNRIIDAVRKENFKFAIDLSPDFDFITAQVPLRAKIPTRAGIIDSEKSAIGERFFNIIMQRSTRLNYENIAKFIGTNG